MPVFLRRSVYGAADTGIREKLYAWLARVVHKAREIQPSLKKYEPGSVTPEFLLDVAKLSATDRGPLVAREYLARRGIPLIIEPALAGTKVDGATVLDDGEKPIIALSIRFDRLDNFWFTLLHELAHVSLHIEKHKSTFVDDTEAISSDDQIEQEANLLAADSFIPRTTWRYSAAPKTRAVADVLELSEQLCISPAIIAGRIRKECGNYRILQSLLGSGQVRELFPEVKWR
jgi:HTH-type transcriptional regulator/antitoxin HigA